MKRLYTLLILACSSIYSYAQNGFTCFTNASAFSNFKAMDNDPQGNIWLTYAGGNSICKFSNSNFSDVPNTALSNIPNYNCIACDNNGNVWLGSNKGLVRYDGANWQLFNQSNSSIPSDTILCLSKKGNAIFGGTPHGAFQLNNGTFTTYDATNSQLLSDYVLSVAASGNSICIGTTAGLSVIENGVTNSYNNTVQGVSMVNVNNLFIDQNNNDIWLTVNTSSATNSSCGNVFVLRNSQLFGVNEILEISQNIPSTIKAIGRGPNNSVIFVDANKTYEIIEDSIHFNFKPYTYANNVSSPAPWNFVLSATKTCFVNNTCYLIPNANKKLIAYTGGNSICPDNHTTSLNYRSLDINNCVAPVMTKGDMFWDLETGNAKYEVPKGTGKSPIFSAALWFSGIDASGALHQAAQMYRQSGNDYTTGPLDTITGASDSITAYEYDRIWKINRFDIESFKYHFLNGTVQNGSFKPASDILSWPAHGTGNYTRKLAPFVDVNNNGIYDPLVGGDYPKIKGDQMLYWIFNDMLPSHEVSASLPLKIEVHASAYAYVCNNIEDSLMAINNTTFYQYEIYNRSQNAYDSCFVASFVDYDLGNYSDDIPGCWPNENVNFSYNADFVDEGTLGYGSPPFISQKILDGPLAFTNDGIDNDNDNVIDEAGEKLLLTNCMANTNSLGIQGNAFTDADFYNYVNSRWKDGTHLTYGGNGYGGSTPTNFIFDGFLSNQSSPWLDTVPDEYRIISSSGPFTFQPGQKIDYEYAFIFNWDRLAPDYNGIYSRNSVFRDYRYIQQWYHQNSFPSCLDLSTVSVKENTNNNALNIYPNPASNELHLSFKSFEPGMMVTIYDATGKLVKQIPTNEIEASQNDLKINLSTLSPGIFLLKYQSSLSTSNHTFVKN